MTDEEFHEALEKQKCCLSVVLTVYFLQDNILKKHKTSFFIHLASFSSKAMDLTIYVDV